MFPKKVLKILFWNPEIGKKQNLKNMECWCLLSTLTGIFLCAVWQQSIPSLEGLTKSAKCLKWSQQTTVSSRDVGAVLKPPAPASCVQLLQIWVGKACWIPVGGLNTLVLLLHVIASVNISYLLQDLHGVTDKTYSVCAACQRPPIYCYCSFFFLFSFFPTLQTRWADRSSAQLPGSVK